MSEKEKEKQNPPAPAPEKTVAEMLDEMKQTYESKITELENKLNAERESYARKEYEKVMGKAPITNPVDNGADMGDIARSEEAIAERLNKKYNKI